MSEVLRLENIKRSFLQGGVRLDILRGVSLGIAKGEIVALLGPSGSGKTTLLQIAGLLERPDEGEVFIGGVQVAARNDTQRTALRGRKIGFVYQFHHLLSDFTALENLMLPQMAAGVPAKEAKAKGLKLLARVGLSQRHGHYPSQLSGGEQQRVAIARGLINDPALLLADEPTGNLDPHTADDVFEMLKDTVRDSSAGALIVTHNMELAQRMDRVLQLKDGVVV